MKKESNMVAILDFVLFMGVIGYIMQFIMQISKFITLIDEKWINICRVENSCSIFILLVFLFVMSILLIYISSLFKKRSKQFPVWFITFFAFGFLSELVIYINNTIMSSSVRVIFNGFFLMIFVLYLYYSEEGKKIFSN